MSIEFSIVIPTLDSEKYLEETIQSIKSQDRSIQIEIIFSDGGSKDNTLKMIDNLNQENLTKVILYNQVGLSNAINEGLKISKGKYLSYLNSDDQLDINALKVLKKKFEDDENKEWIIGLCKNIGNSKILNSIINYYKSSLLKKLNFNLLCINNIISQPSVYWKRSLFEKVGKFDKKLNFNMDYDMWLRMMKISKPYVLNCEISYFRRHDKSLSHKNLTGQFFEKYKTMRKNNNNILINILHITCSIIILIIYKLTKY